MTHRTKLIVIVACGAVIVAISVAAIAQGFGPSPAPGPYGPVPPGFGGPGYGMPMMPPAPTQPVMQVHSPAGGFGGHVYILQGNVLYKVQMAPFKQVGTLRLAPPPPVHPFGGPGTQPQ